MGLLLGLERFALEGLKRLVGDAQPGDVRAGKTFSNAEGNDKVGTLADRGNGGLVTPGTADQTLLAGIYNTDIVVAGDPDLETANIKAGANIFGVAGTVVEATGDALAGDVLTGKTFSKAGQAGIAGTMPNRGAPTWTPGTAAQNLSAGYYSGGTVQGDPDLITSNIRSGKNIFGVDGSLIEGLDFSQTGFLDAKGGFPGTNATTATMIDITGSGYLVGFYMRTTSTDYWIQVVLDGKLLGKSVGPSGTEASMLAYRGGFTFLGLKFNSSLTVKIGYSNTTYLGLLYTLD